MRFARVRIDALDDGMRMWASHECRMNFVGYMHRRDSSAASDSALCAGPPAQAELHARTIACDSKISAICAIFIKWHRAITFRSFLLAPC
jgi:hypothetical protein